MSYISHAGPDRTHLIRGSSLSLLVEMLNNNPPLTSRRNVSCLQKKWANFSHVGRKSSFSFIISGTLHLLRNGRVGVFKHNAIKLRNSHLAVSVSLNLRLQVCARRRCLPPLTPQGFPKCSCQLLYPASHGVMHYSQALHLSFDVVKLIWQILRQHIRRWRRHSRCTHKPFVTRCRVGKFSQVPTGSRVWKLKKPKRKKKKQTNKRKVLKWLLAERCGCLYRSHHRETRTNNTSPPANFSPQ